MNERAESLHAGRTRLPAVPLLLVASLVLFGLGLWLPALETQKLVVSVSSYSILQGIADLYENHWPTALLVLSFSVVFPLVKLAGLGYVWFAPLPEARRTVLVRRLDVLGKWSMLDVFVVAILMGTVNLGFPSGASARAGVYVFGSAVLLSMCTARLVMWDAGIEETPRRRASGRRLVASHAVGVAALVCYGLGLERTMLHTAKWHFWDTDYSIFQGTLELLDSAPVLAVAVLVLVVALPLGRLSVSVVFALLLHAGRIDRIPRASIPGRWAMGDVFALAVLVVATKLSDALVVEFRSGLWCFGAGVVLALLYGRLATRPVTEAGGG